MSRIPRIRRWLSVPARDRPELMAAQPPPHRRSSAYASGTTERGSARTEGADRPDMRPPHFGTLTCLPTAPNGGDARVSA